jgi:transposase
MGWRPGQSHSQDLRDRVFKAVDGGMAVREAAPLFGGSVAYIYKALIRRRATGDSGINPRRGHRGRKLSSDQELAMAAHIRAHPGITLAQVQAWLLAKQNIELSTGATWNTARLLGLSFKKKPCARPSRTGQTSQLDASSGEPRSLSWILKA